MFSYNTYQLITWCIDSLFHIDGYVGIEHICLAVHARSSLHLQKLHSDKSHSRHIYSCHAKSCMLDLPLVMVNIQPYVRPSYSSTCPEITEKMLGIKNKKKNLIQIRKGNNLP